MHILYVILQHGAAPLATTCPPVSVKKHPPDKKIGWQTHFLRLDCDFCCQVAWPRLTSKDCFFRRSPSPPAAGSAAPSAPESPSEGYTIIRYYMYIYIYICICIYMYIYIYMYMVRVDAVQTPGGLPWSGPISSLESENRLLYYIILYYSIPYYITLC